MESVEEKFSSSTTTIAAVFISCLATFLVPSIASLFQRLVLSKQHVELRDSRKELVKLMEELQELSPINNFAAYSRLKRRIAALKKSIQAQEYAYAGDGVRWRLGAAGVFYVILAFVAFVVLKKQGGKAVTRFDPDWFYPLNIFLGWTTEDSVQHPLLNVRLASVIVLGSYIARMLGRSSPSKTS